MKHLPYSQIKQDLKRSGSSLRAIARELGVSHTAVVDVAKQDRSSARISRALADKLNVSLERVLSAEKRGKSE